MSETLYTRAKSYAVDPAANTVYYWNRAIKALVAATFSETGSNEYTEPSGTVLIHNRTAGDLFIWLGPCPAGAQSSANMQLRGIKIPAGGTYEPLWMQKAALYLVVPTAGVVHIVEH